MMHIDPAVFKDKTKFYRKNNPFSEKDTPP